MPRDDAGRNAGRFPDITVLYRALSSSEQSQPIMSLRITIGRMASWAS